MAYTLYIDSHITANFEEGLACFDLIREVDPSHAGGIDVDPYPNCDNGQYLIGTSVELTAWRVFSVFNWVGWTVGRRLGL